MEHASPVWKEKIFGPEGEERPKPTDEEEDWILLLDGNDHPLAITMQIALIHDRPDCVPRWRNNPDTASVCIMIFDFMVAADKYGVLPLFRPFVSHRLVHADWDGVSGKNSMHRLEAAWQLGARGLVEDHVRRHVYHPGSTPVGLEELVAKVKETCDENGILMSVPKLLNVGGKRQVELIQSALDFFHQVLADLHGEEGNCQQSVPKCNALLYEFISKRLEQNVWQIPVEAIDYPEDIHRLLHTTTHILGTRCNPGPKQLEGHGCVPAFHKKIEDFSAALLNRWKGADSAGSILEPEQVEWLKKRSELLATDSWSSCRIL